MANILNVTYCITCVCGTKEMHGSLTLSQYGVFSCQMLPLVTHCAKTQDLDNLTVNFNYEINYQLDAIEYLFVLSYFSSTCFGLTRPSSGAIGVTISYKCSIWCPW